MSKHIITIPDLGGATDVEVIEIAVSAGDVVAKEDTLITVEGDKASMDIPAPHSGTVSKIQVTIGDTVNEGDTIIEFTQEAESTEPAAKKVVKEETVINNNATEPQTKNHTELLVIGAGPGGYTAAFRAADLGLNVTLIERYPTLGGVCLNVGCIPSKALLHSASVIAQAREMQAHGISFGKPKVDVEKLRHFKESVINKLTGGLASMAKQRKVNVIQGMVKFSANNRVTITSGETESELSFDKAIIAAGSRVTTLPIFDIDDERIIDSTGALELKDIPKTMLIVGGGIIGLEMATVYSELGCKIDIVEFMPQIIPGADKDLIAPLQKRMKGLVNEIMINTKVTELSPQKAAIQVHFASAKDSDKAIAPRNYDKVLVATGRQPNGDLLDAQNAGVNVNDRGFIEVNEQMQTNVEYIFAIGDIVGQPMLAHKATHEAKVAAEVCAGHKSGFEANVIPSVAYTDPEIAWVGLTETQAKAEGIAYETGVFPWAASGRAIGNDRTEGKTKLLFDPKTHKVLGGGVVGTNAGELIGEVALAIEMGCEASDIGLTIHPHPTLIETVAMAAEAYEGTITDLYIPKK